MPYGCQVPPGVPVTKKHHTLPGAGGAIRACLPACLRSSGLGGDGLASSQQVVRHRKLALVNVHARQAHAVPHQLKTRETCMRRQKLVNGARRLMHVECSPLSPYACRRGSRMVRHSRMSIRARRRFAACMHRCALTPPGATAHLPDPHLRRWASMRPPGPRTLLHLARQGRGAVRHGLLLVAQLAVHLR